MSQMKSSIHVRIGECDKKLPLTANNNQFIQLIIRVYILFNILYKHCSLEKKTRKKETTCTCIISMLMMCNISTNKDRCMWLKSWGGGVLPYVGYIGMCHCEG